MINIVVINSRDVSYLNSKQDVKFNYYNIYQLGYDLITLVLSTLLIKDAK